MDCQMMLTRLCAPKSTTPRSLLVGRYCTVIGAIMIAVVGFVLPKIIMPTNFDSMVKQMVIWNKQRFRCEVQSGCISFETMTDEATRVYVYGAASPDDIMKNAERVLFYAWHVTNPRQVVEGSRPVLQEMGPYGYAHIITKDAATVAFVADTVFYKERSYYAPLPRGTASNGTDGCALYLKQIGQPIQLCQNDMEKVTFLNTVFLEIVHKKTAKGLIAEIAQKLWNHLRHTLQIDFMRVVKAGLFPTILRKITRHQLYHRVPQIVDVAMQTIIQNSVKSGETKEDAKEFAIQTFREGPPVDCGVANISSSWAFQDPEWRGAKLILTDRDRMKLNLRNCPWATGDLLKQNKLELKQAGYILDPYHTLVFAEDQGDIGAGSILSSGPQGYPLWIQAANYALNMSADQSSFTSLSKLLCTFGGEDYNYSNTIYRRRCDQQTKALINVFFGDGANSWATHPATRELFLEDVGSYNSFGALSCNDSIACEIELHPRIKGKVKAAIDREPNMDEQFELIRSFKEVETRSTEPWTKGMLSRAVVDALFYDGGTDIMPSANLQEKAKARRELSLLHDLRQNWFPVAQYCNNHLSVGLSGASCEHLEEGERARDTIFEAFAYLDDLPAPRPDGLGDRWRQILFLSGGLTSPELRLGKLLRAYYMSQTCAVVSYIGFHVSESSWFDSQTVNHLRSRNTMLSTAKSLNDMAFAQFAGGYVSETVFNVSAISEIAGAGFSVDAELPVIAEKLGWGNLSLTWQEGEALLEALSDTSTADDGRSKGTLFNLKILQHSLLNSGQPQVSAFRDCGECMHEFESIDGCRNVKPGNDQSVVMAKGCRHCSEIVVQFCSNGMMEQRKEDVVLQQFHRRTCQSWTNQSVDLGLSVCPGHVTEVLTVADASIGQILGAHLLLHKHDFFLQNRFWCADPMACDYTAGGLFKSIPVRYFLFEGYTDPFQFYLSQQQTLLLIPQRFQTEEYQHLVYDSAEQFADTCGLYVDSRPLWPASLRQPLWPKHVLQPCKETSERPPKMTCLKEKFYAQKTVSGKIDVKAFSASDKLPPGFSFVTDRMCRKQPEFDCTHSLDDGRENGIHITVPFPVVGSTSAVIEPLLYDRETTGQGAMHSLLGEAYGYPLKYDFYLQQISVPVGRDLMGTNAFENGLVDNPFNALFFGKAFAEDEFQKEVSCPRDSRVLGTSWTNCRIVENTGNLNLSTLGIQTAYFGNHTSNAHQANKHHPWWIHSRHAGGVSLKSYGGKSIPPKLWEGFSSAPLPEIDVFFTEVGLPFRLQLDGVSTLKYDKGDTAAGAANIIDNIEIDLHTYCMTQAAWEFTMSSIKNSSLHWPAAMFDVSSIWRDDLPFFQSFPHFMYNEEWGGQEHTHFDGLRPNHDRHRTCFYFDPITGQALQTNRRFQLNFVVQQSVLFPDLCQEKLYFPIIWTERGKIVNPDAALAFQGSILMVYGLMVLTTGLGIGFGFLALLSGVSMIIYGSNEKKNRLQATDMQYAALRKAKG